MGDAPAAASGVRVSLALAAALCAVIAATPPSSSASRPTAAGQPPLAGAPTDSRSLPDRIGARPIVRQMITVSARSWSARHAKLTAWRRSSNGSWRPVRGPMRAVIGYNGWVIAEQRVQSTGTTPAGRFRLPYAFGRYADPGAQVRYRRVDRNDWWPYEPRDPATYNVYQFHKAPNTHWRPNKAEHLNSYTKQYGYAIVIGFNLPSGIHYSRERGQWVADRQAHLHRGGGIFLHIRGDGYTAGCVAVSRANMRWLVRWLRPDSHARVVMGPRDYIVSL
jgi:L,D-peptidoglycan transpeptidase YkuD (ErfK/YbiS/YcfS/YnhG family)